MLEGDKNSFEETVKTINTCEVLNFSDKCLEIGALYKVWLKRQKNTTRQSSSSKIVDFKNIHLWMLLPNPPNNLVNELQKTVFQFVWNRKQEGISRKKAIRSIAKEGLRIPNIKTY